MLSLIRSSGKAANVPKPASVGITPSQIRIAFMPCPDERNEIAPVLPTETITHPSRAGACCASGFQSGLCRLGVKMRRTRIEHILSALPPLATEERTFGNGSSVPQADICSAAIEWLFDHLVGADHQREGTSMPRTIFLCFKRVGLSRTAVAVALQRSRRSGLAGDLR
jgi:hypothetical protein